MNDIQQEVKDWLHTQKDWLQQAAELLLTKAPLDDNDIMALVENLKTTEGQTVSDNRAFNGLEGGAIQTAEVRLTSIGDITGIENLGPSSPLNFGEGNLCVIYGNNGSGKSGYARLVKKAAGKTGAKELRSNVFKVSPTEQKCKFIFNDGSEKMVEWHTTDAPIDALRAVDIFDSDTANNYLTRDNEATYTPPVVSLFDKLVGIVKKITERLQVQQAALVKALPDIPQQYVVTKSGAQYNGLRVNSNTVEVQKIQTWTDAEEQELAQLNERLAATDPAALAKQKRARKTLIEQIANQMRKDSPAYAEEALGAIRTERQEAQAKRKIAEEAAQVASAKLDGVGSDTWKALWEAARNYSQTPYPDRDFPVVDDARCVLCHQGLAEDAKQRLQDFENFVQGDVEQAAIKAETTYRTKLAQLPVGLAEQIHTDRCNAAGLTDGVLIAGIKAFWQQIATSHAAMQLEEVVEAAAAVAVPQDIIATLDATVNALEEQSKQHDLDTVGFNRAEATQKKVELEAKHWTSLQSVAITAEILRLKTVSEYEDWIRLTNTQQITKKGGQVAEAAITDAYVSRFNKELENLKAKKVKVKLVKTMAEKGKAYHGLQLDGVVDENAKLEQVLSEGERRIISLAAFLADVAEKPHASTFIFDDPISSLDQDFEIAVAKRLVQLANSRQVLVFTHRLSLYGALEDAAGKMGQDDKRKEWKSKNLVQRCIETFSNVAGRPVDQPIWAADTEDANRSLLARLDDAQKVGDESGSVAYTALAQGICSDFRKLVERTVEADLLNKVVIRHRRSVTTDGRLSKLANISTDDCRFIDDLMTKYSSFEHSQSTENPVEIPEEADLRGDLEALKTWRNTFKKKPANGVLM